MTTQETHDVGFTYLCLALGAVFGSTYPLGLAFLFVHWFSTTLPAAIGYWFLGLAVGALTEGYALAAFYTRTSTAKKTP